MGRELARESRSVRGEKERRNPSALVKAVGKSEPGAAQALGIVELRETKKREQFLIGGTENCRMNGWISGAQ